MKNKWSCDVCLLINDSTRSVCAACSNPKSGSTEKHTPVSQLSHLTPVPGSWVCDTCLVNNKMANINCIACKTSKPGTGSSTKQSSIFQPLQLSHLAPAPGSWTCDTCLLSNKMVDNSCIACKNPKPGTTAIVSQSCPPPAPLKVTFPSITPSSPQLQPSSGGVKLDILKTSPLSSMVPSGFAAISQPIGAGGFHLGGLKLGSGDLKLGSGDLKLGSGGLKLGSGSSQAPEEEEEQKEVTSRPDGVDEQDTGENISDDVVLVNVEMPPEDLIKKAEELMLPSSFYLYLNKPPCSGCCGCEDETEEGAAITHEKHEVINKDDKVNSDIQQPGTEIKPDWPFTAGSTNLSSFSDLAAKQTGFQFSFLSPASSGTAVGTGATFPGAGQALFGSGQEGRGENEEDNPEAEVDIHVKPLVSLPKLETVSTGEEEEEVVFSNRAKLYRFDEPTKQWKERGLGDIKILRHKKTMKYRVLMRREQILKICCNHSLTPEMRLMPFSAHPKKAWLWFTLSDLSEETPRPEKLAVRFREEKTAEEFQKAFEQGCKIISSTEAQEENEEPKETANRSSKTSDNENIDRKSPEQSSISSSSSWECSVCLVHNDTAATSCIACSASKPSYSPSSISPPDSTSDTVPSLSSLPPTSAPAGLTNKPGMLSFADLVEQSPQFSFSSRPTSFSFSGAGQQLFSSSKEDEKEEDNPEAEVDIHVKPLVSLPKLETVSTGEEEEEVLFSHRAKLYRFDDPTKQWKERGLGDIKILKHKQTRKCRILMRRDQIFKICCNHFIFSTMSLNPHGDTGKCWMWFTLCEFSEEEAKPEKFLVRFKNANTAEEFKKCFDSCVHEDTKVDNDIEDEEGNDGNNEGEENDDDDEDEKESKQVVDQEKKEAQKENEKENSEGDQEEKEAQEDGKENSEGDQEEKEAQEEDGKENSEGDQEEKEAQEEDSKQENGRYRGGRGLCR